MNKFKTFLLMFALIALFVIVGDIMGGRQGMVMAFTIAVFTNFIAYWFSDKIVLMMYGARPVSEIELPEVYSIVRELTMRTALPQPKVYLMEDASPNAFATGRDPKHAAVAVTSGILKVLDKKELAGVIAHELSHIKNRDTLIQVIAATIAGAIFMLARMAQYAMIFGGGRDDRDERGGAGGVAMLVVMIIAPIAAMIIQLAISRSREYQADESAAGITQEPLGLASALQKLEDSSKRIPIAHPNPATAHLFIVNPIHSKDRGGNLLSIFSTHPPIQERIRRLEEMAGRVRER
ncbi:MAG: zinc metalloprotease HtpX [Elusimicrobiota bacterium]